MKGECDFRYSLFDFRVHLIVDAERSGKLFGIHQEGYKTFFISQCSSVGRAADLESAGRGFESLYWLNRLQTGKETQNCEGVRRSWRAGPDCKSGVSD